MNHLFVVHSGITYLVSRLTMIREAIPPEQTHFLGFRNAPIYADDLARATELRGVHYDPEPDYQKVTRSQFNQLKDALDAQLYELTRGADFALYAPNYSIKVVQLISTLPNCTQCFAIEDGSGFYRPYHDLLQTYRPRFSLYRKVLNAYRFGRRLTWSGLLDPRCQKVYTMSKFALEGDPRTVVVRPNTETLLRWRPAIEDSVAEGAWVFIFDGLAAYLKVTLDAYLKAFAIFVADLAAAGPATIQIKFHPAQTLAERHQITQLLNDSGVGYTIIADHTLIDSEVILRSDLSVFGFVSTVLLYATFGQNSCVWSYADRLHGFNIKQMPTIFLERVRMSRQLHSTKPACDTSRANFTLTHQEI